METHQPVQFPLLGLDLLNEAVDLLLVVVELEQLLLKLAVHLTVVGREGEGRGGGGEGEG